VELLGCDVPPQQNAAKKDHQQSVEHRNDAVGHEHQQPVDIRPQIENRGHQELVESQKRQKIQMPAVVTYDKARRENDDEIDACQQETQHADARKMLVQQVLVLGYVPVVEIGDTKIEKDVEEEGKVKNGEIKTVFTGCGHVLNRSVNAKYPKWLHQQVDEQKKTEIGDKFTLHPTALVPGKHLCGD